MQKSMESSQVQTLVKDRHLKPGELEELFYFLQALEEERKRKQESPETTRQEVAKYFKEVSSTPPSQEEYDWCERLDKLYIQDGLKYRSTSTYGRTAKEIIQNAREHILNCPACLAQYKTAIQRDAYHTASDTRKFLEKAYLEIEHEDSFKEKFEHLTQRGDKLGILSKK